MYYPLHPFIVHFPIGFLVAALILQTVHLLRPNWICRIVGLWLTGLSSVALLFASITGQAEYKKALNKDNSMEVMTMLDQHQLIGNIITWATIVFFIVWLYLYFKKMEDRRIDKIAQIILFVIVAAVFLTARIGGKLVWEYGVGIKSVSYTHLTLPTIGCV